MDQMDASKLFTMPCATGAKLMKPCFDPHTQTDVAKLQTDAKSAPVHRQILEE